MNYISVIAYLVSGYGRADIDIVEETQYNLDKMPVHHRAT